MHASPSLLDHIEADLADRSVRFVFPSAVASQFWARRCAEHTLRPVDQDRFIAWDVFKAAVLSTSRPDAVPANEASRILFSAALLAENAQAAAAGKPLLTEIVAADFAASHSPFIGALAKTLPAIDGIVKRLCLSDLTKDAYFADLAVIHERYRRFLDAYALYEGAWNRAPFKFTDTRWVLFFPELAEDWTDYEEELRRQASVRIVDGASLSPAAADLPRVQALLSDLTDRLIRFDTYQEESRWIALTVRRLLDEGGLQPSDIALSIPGLDDYAERLALEFQLRDLPLDLRLGQALSDHSGGRLFAALAACPGTRWSYRALKDLLLDNSLPWKNRETIDALMDFGLRYRCVAGFREGNREVDVWERTFDRLRAGPSGGAPLSIRKFYGDLKRDISAIVGAKNFSDLRTKLLHFKTNHLDQGSFAPETDKIIARALEELSLLAQTEARLTGVAVPDPYGIFQTHLRGITYVYQSETVGVSVYKYRVAAGIHPVVHILANMSQDAATVRAAAAPFLREDRKQRLALVDTDLSKPFLRTYAHSGSFVLFTAAQRSPGAFTVPHRLFSEPPFLPALDAHRLEFPADPLEEELGLASGRKLTSASAPTLIQRAGREAALIVRGPGLRVDFRAEPVADARLAAELRRRLTESGARRSLSPTDLNEYRACPFAWLLSRGLGIRDKQTEIETIDQRDLGILYHRILERFFKRLQSEGTRFHADQLPRYQMILREEVEAALLEQRDREGAFQESVYAMLAARIRAALSDYLETDQEHLDGCAFVGAEYPLQRNYAALGISLAGTADLVLQSGAGSLVLTDFKTANMPDAVDLTPGEDGLIGNLQIAAYIRMIEDEGAEPVAEARFYSLDNRTYQKVVSLAPPARSNLLLPVPREKYQNAIDAVDQTVAAIADNLALGNFPVPDPDRRDVCASCRVASVCRIGFSGGEL
jgi:hypothetical protein